MTSKKNMFQEYIRSNDNETEGTDSSDSIKKEDLVVELTPEDQNNKPQIMKDEVNSVNKNENHSNPTIEISQEQDSDNSFSKNRIDIEFQTAASLLKERNQMIKIPTGCKAFDKIIGGGIEPRSITEFYGAYTTGKTQMSIQLAFNTALPSKLGGLNGDVVYIDSEGSFRPERIIQMANEFDIDPKIILDKILIGRAHNSDIQMTLVDNVLELSESKNIKLLVVDSLTAAFRAEYIGKGALVDRQQKLNKHMRQLSRVADILNIAVVVTNQVSAVIDGFENTVIPVGGNIIAHGSTHRLHFKKSPKRPQIRVVDLVASPSYPEASAAFEIAQSGIRDVNFSSFVPRDENN
ncbi:MAG: DNA repair and recombination protein RadA [Candidatus Heimdallarchaeota archaeon LC_2]|nr:MAG: DNA repair and recombination protein RadA [Candidatus Heimdallarchaeota archaeon LC_2]